MDINQLVSYQQRSSHEISQIKLGLGYGAVFALVLWATLISLLLLVLR